MTILGSRHSDTLAWGLTLFVLGALVLSDRTGATDSLHFSGFIHSPGTYFLIAGIIFLVYKKEKILGLLFTAIGSVVHFDVFFGWMQDYRNFLLPVTLPVAGLALIISNRRRQR